MPLTRTPDWEIRFATFLRERASVPFAWGTNDCCTFSADAVLAMTGTDIADDFRGKYTDEKSAFLLIRSLTSGSTTADAVIYAAAQHGLVEHTYPLMAKRGDLVVIDNAGTLIAGVVHLNGRDVVSVSASGAVRLPITSITRSWSV
jgi:hypothetical protein